MEAAKKDTEQVEDVPQATSREVDKVNVALQMPAPLAALAAADYRRLHRRATLKMDLIIVPVVVVMYILNYLDRQNIASAKLADITTDLGISGVEYETAVSILFCGYILMQVPSNMVVGRIRWPGAYICGGMAAWGAVSALTAAVHSYAGLLVTRVFLGFVEAVFFVGALYFLSLFYTRRQFALRTAILYSGSQLGNAFGGLFAIGILNLSGRGGLEGWRWLFLVEGVLTSGLAIIFAFILPNSPRKILGLSQLECECVQWEMATEQGFTAGASKTTSPLQGLAMAVVDPKTWLLTGILYCTYIVGAVTNFFPSVVGGLGYDRDTTYGLTAPPFILCVACMLANGFASDRRQERFLHVALPLLVTLAANVVAVSSLGVGARYAAMMLLPASFYASSVVTLSWIAGSLAQPPEKRAAAIALVNALCNTPNIWGSYLYYGAPRYVTAFIVNVVAAALAIAFAVATRLYLRRENARLARGVDTGKNGPTPEQVAGGFRYLL